MVQISQRDYHAREVKIFMRLPDGNTSTAHLSVLYNGLIHQYNSLLAWWLEITVHCLCPDDYVRHDNESGNRDVHVWVAKSYFSCKNKQLTDLAPDSSLPYPI
jgi:hypothetical protein